MVKNKNAWIVGILIALIIIINLFIFLPKQSDTIKIGIITDLTGSAAYWGESTRAGVEIAAKELREQGYDFELIYEDAQLDAAKALSSAQKLVNIDDVDAIYAEFNPAAISVGSFIKNKDVLFVYDAAPVSPLENAPYSYKTYIDYREGCRQITEKFKNEGVKNMGVLKVNIEFGELCLKGVKEIYPNARVESYNLGETDFKTQILKLDNDGVEVIINVGFVGDTLNALKVIREQGFDIKYGTTDDAISEEVIELYSKELEGAINFGFKDISPDFKEKIKDSDLDSEYGAALAYTHIKQIVKALDKCGEDLDCVAVEMDNASSDSTIGFQKFNNRIAEFDMKIKEY